MYYIDTHAHLDGEEFAEDRDDVVRRAKEAGVGKIFVPAIDMKSLHTVMDTCKAYKGYAYPMLGLHPEEVKADYKSVLADMKSVLDDLMTAKDEEQAPIIAIGEVGLDYYWSREFEAEQVEAFEEQVKWAVDYKLPLSIHCRKAQNEMVKVLRKYQKDLCGGVFHCFTGNEKEAAELLSFDNFVLGIGGVLTFKKSHLPEVLASVPLDRVVLETDSPYMAPVPMRGKRNESAYVQYVLKRMAESYGVAEDVVARQTTDNVIRVFRV